MHFRSAHNGGQSQAHYKLVNQGKEKPKLVVDSENRIIGAFLHTGSPNPGEKAVFVKIDKRKTAVSYSPWPNMGELYSPPSKFRSTLPLDEKINS